ncbi:hypothetical protein BC943DRAFT_352951 [Umbelopsis sp. AD052]|nr:hypothetical protein BC943DRAFT_352951 [Umbelopsis sp. AD052]
MPGFTLEDPYPLSAFKSTTLEAVGQRFCVDVLPVDASIPTGDASEIDGTAESNLAAVTVQGEAIKLYNISDQNCIKSWSTPPSVVFNGPARILTKQNDNQLDRYIYIAVASGPDITSKEEGRVVWLWKDSDESAHVDSAQDAGLKKTTKMFKDKIQAVLVSPVLQTYVLLVNENGSVALVTADLGRVAANYEPSKSDRTVVWSNIITTPSTIGQSSFIPTSMVPVASTLVATLTKTKNAYTLTILYVNEERRSVDELTSFDIQSEKELVSYSFHAQKGIFCVLDQSGTWSVYQIKLKHGPSNKVVADVTKPISLPLNNLHRDTPTKSHASLISNHNTLAMTTLQDNYVAIVTGNKHSTEHIVSIWDVRYGTLQTSTSIKNDTSSQKTKDTKSSDSHIMYKITSLPNTTIALTVSSLKRSGIKQSKGSVISSSVVYIIHYHYAPMSLLAAMNTMKVTSQQLNIQGSGAHHGIGILQSGHDAMNNFISFDDQEPEQQVFDSWVKNIDSNQQAQDRVLSQLMASGISTADFTKTFLQYAKHTNEANVTSDIVMAENGNDVSDTLDNSSTTESPSQATKQSRNKDVENVANLSYQVLQAVVSKCFATLDNGKPNLDFWPVAVLEFLASRGVLYSNFVSGGIVPAVMAREDWHILAVVLKHVQDIPEADLIRVVRTMAEKVREDEATWKDKFALYFKLVVEAPRNDIFMQQAVKRIGADELFIVLQTLRDWMDWWDEQGGGSSTKNSEPAGVPKFVHVIEFANIFLDVHFPTLILESSMHELVQALRERERSRS